MLNSPERMPNWNRPTTTCRERMLNWQKSSRNWKTAEEKVTRYKINKQTSTGPSETVLFVSMPTLYLYHSQPTNPTNAEHLTIIHSVEQQPLSEKDNYWSLELLVLLLLLVIILWEEVSEPPKAATWHSWRMPWEMKLPFRYLEKGGAARANLLATNSNPSIGRASGQADRQRRQISCVRYELIYTFYIAFRTT